LQNTLAGSARTGKNDRLGGIGWQIRCQFAADFHARRFQRMLIPKDRFECTS
jgi:hypothetical protein